jgi:hypothetical protein
MIYELAEAAIALSIERGFALRLAEKAMLRGWALVEQGGHGGDGPVYAEAGRNSNNGAIPVQPRMIRSGLIPRSAVLLQIARGKSARAAAPA